MLTLLTVTATSHKTIISETKKKHAANKEVRTCFEKEVIYFLVTTGLVYIRAPWLDFCLHHCGNVVFFCFFLF